MKETVDLDWLISWKVLGSEFTDPHGNKAVEPIQFVQMSMSMSEGFKRSSRCRISRATQLHLEWPAQAWQQYLMQGCIADW